MKKQLIGAICLLLALMLLGCGPKHACQNPCPQCNLCLNNACTEEICTEKCPGHHVCKNPCTECALCIDPGCTESACEAKCAGHKEEPYPFSPGDFITTEPTVIECQDVVFEIGENIYVPGNIGQIADRMSTVIQEIAGLTFANTPYPGPRKDGKVVTDVSKKSLYIDHPGYQGLATNEFGVAYGGTSMALSPGDLFLGFSYTYAHEITHVLMYRQSSWYHCQLLDEGFAEYTAFLALQQIEKTDPELAPYLSSSIGHIYQMEIFDYDKLFEHPVEYWFENNFEYSGNANYAIGFRFMWYLQEVYGDYGKWITEFEAAHNYRTTPKQNSNAPIPWLFDILKACYGEDVLDNFYPWLQENLSLFDMHTYGWPGLTDIPDQWLVDRSKTQAINLYPTFSSYESRVYLANIQYDDLYINLETTRKYLTEYKGLDASGLTLSVEAEEPVIARLYQADGSNRQVTLTDSPTSLDGIAYLKLVGQGFVDRLHVSGFEGEANP